MPLPLKRFSYADYEDAVRRPHYHTLHTISKVTAARFAGCRRVLDIASGQGLFLDTLRGAGVPAYGVDSETTLVQQCNARGLNVTEDDVLHFLQTTTVRFDGAYCGHLIEHLPYEALLDLIESIQRVLEPEALLVLRWPNPRAAIAHLALYWKDPTHRWLYDGELIEAILRFYGFEIKEAHYDTITPRGAAVATGTAPSVMSRRKGMQGLRDQTFQSLQDLSRGAAPALIPLVQRLEAHIQTRTLDRQARLAFQLPTEAQIVAQRISLETT